MALNARAASVTNSSTPLVAAVTGRRTNVRRLNLRNNDSVQHDVTLLDGSTTRDILTLGPGAQLVVDYQPKANGIGQLFTAGTAVNVQTSAAATANSVSVSAEYGRI